MNVKKGAKRLSLSRETVRELQRDEMKVVAGGVATGQISILGCPSWNITVCDCTGNYTYQGC